MEHEIEVINDRNVWELVPKPNNTKILGNRWVYTIKKDEKGHILRYKARLVAKGYTQLKGVSYDEVFSPVVNFGIVRLFFSIFVSYYKWMHYQLDIKNAYLYAPLNNEVYMYQPKGFENPDKPNHVCLLKKALYGLHQSGREWFFEIHSILKSINFKNLKWVNCVYYYKNNVILLLYVDDIVIFGKTDEHINEVISLLQTNFDLKLLGKTKKLLGVNFEEINGNLVLHQEDYITTVFQKFKSYNPPIASLPVTKGTMFSKQQSPKTEAEIEEMSNFPYRSLIGCLAFIASRTRPDISFIVNLLSQFQANPGRLHWEALLKVLGYVYYSRNYKLNLYKINNISLKYFSDASFADNVDDRSSTSGLIIFLDEVPIFWGTRKQRHITLSTMESELVALTDAVKEAKWMMNIFKEMKKRDILQEDAEHNVFCDNLATINFSKSPIENIRTKHIHIRYLFIRDLIYKKLFNLKYINSKNNLADIFTKPLNKFEIRKFVSYIYYNVS